MPAALHFELLIATRFSNATTINLPQVMHYYSRISAVIDLCEASGDFDSLHSAILDNCKLYLAPVFASHPFSNVVILNLEKSLIFELWH